VGIQRDPIGDYVPTCTPRGCTGDSRASGGGTLRATKTEYRLKGTLPFILAPFQVQLYLEQGREYSTASIWGDFRRSQRPHREDEEFYVEMALNAEMQYIRIPPRERY